MSGWSAPGTRTELNAPTGGSLARRTFLIGGAAGLAGCTGLLPPPNPTIIGVRMLADDTINPSPTGIASPVIVRLYVLKDLTAFMQSDFQTLYTSDAQILGSSMILKKEVVVPPMGNIPIQDTVPQDAVYLGVVAVFRNIEQAQWRATIGLQPNLVNNVQVNLSGLTATFMSVLVGNKGFVPPPTPAPPAPPPPLQIPTIAAPTIPAPTIPAPTILAPPG